MDESRKQFTTWFNSPEQSELRMSCSMGWAYKIWCASRAAIEIVLDKEVTNVTNKYYEEGRDDVIEAIRATGIKVKE
ncbi:hypothetical protein [Enterobacter roggenkampii]|uniref:hypothetical protein n=1 Tax=Enterobacter roggenkampii TaxID=1812935 RepID=UPI00399C1CEC